MSEVGHIPQLRFSEFSGEWKEKKLGDVGETFNGLTGKTKEDFGKGKPYIQYTQIFESSKININNFGLVDVRDNENQKTAQYGDVFFTTSSETPEEVGYSSVLLDNIGDLYLNSFCFGFRPSSLNELNPNFAQFLMRSADFRKRVIRLAQGSTRYNMSKVQLMKEFVKLPSLEEQQKIAAFLTTVDNKIEQLSKKQKLLGEYKKGLMQQIFSQAIRFKADDGGDFPEWEEKKLGDVSVRGISNISANQLEDNNGDYKIYGAAGHLKNIDFYTEEDCYVAIVKDGAGVGRIMLLESKTSVLGTLAIIKAKQGNDINFLYWLIQTINFRKYVVGSTIPHIYYRDYQAENLRIPSLSEQTKIANFLSSIDTKIEQVSKQLDESKQFKKALLQQMFV